MAHALVCGGGFGGLAAAHRLRSLLDDTHEVTVVDHGDRFFMGFAKLWELSGQRPLAAGTRELARLERAGIRFRQAEITDLDPGARTVATTRGTIAGDALVVALGATPPARHRDLLDGDDAFDLYDAATLGDVRLRLEGMSAGRVLIAILGGPFKCPPAPYEAALIVDRILRERGTRTAVDIALATPQPLTVPAAGVDASRFVATHLEDRGVAVLTRRQVTEVVHDGRLVRFADGSEERFDLLLGVPADAPLEVVAASAVSDDDGWIRPDRATFGTGFDRVYAIGDCTAIPTATGALPHAGVFAAAAGEVAAANAAADLVGGDRASFDGHGYCFLELPDEQVAFIEGDFYADPPDVTLAEPSREQFEKKQAFERDRLERWLPPVPPDDPVR